MKSDVSTPIVIEPSRSWLNLNLVVLWEYRELLFFLAWRDLKARYAQTVIGLAWAVLQPLALMIIFTLVFGRLINIPTDGVPYALFAYSALIPWTFFSKSLDRGATSVVSDANLVTKVYFPRAIVPGAAVLGGIVDFAISFILLLVMMIWYGVVPGWRLLTIPFLFLATVIAAATVALWLAGLYVKYRDVGAIIPLVTQVWMFASPIIYPLSMVPEHWRTLYSLNPLVGIIEGFRWALFGVQAPDVVVMTQNLCVVLALFIGGLAYFNRLERTFADVI